MSARRKRKNKKQMTLGEQARAIAKVAALSFKTAPGAVLFKIAGAFLNALLPLATVYFAALTTSALVDAYAGSESAKSAVLSYVVITSLLGLFQLAWGSVDGYIQASMRYRVESKVSDQMYEQFLSLDFWRYDDKVTADLYDKAKKFAQFFAWIFDRLASIISQLITSLAAIIALVLLNGWLAVLVLVAIVPGVYIQFKLSRAQIAHWNSNVDTRRTRSMIDWNLFLPQSITELRLYGIVRYLLDLRKKLRDKDEKIRIDFERSYMGKRLLAVVLQTGAELGSLLWVIFEIVAHRLPVGQFVYVQQVVSRAINGANSFISDLSTIDEDVANLFEYEQFMRLERSKERHGQLTEPPRTVGFSHVSFRYPGTDHDVLRDIDFTLEKNQHIAIVGENGAGKSTLIKLLAGIYAPTAGDVTLDDQPLRDIDPSSWHRHLAILQQDFMNYAFANARDNVLFGDVEKKDMGRLDRALKDAEASEFIAKLPYGLDTYLHNWIEDDDGKKGVDLSGGQWQRLALARNFYRDAPFIILDEPTSAIDALAEARIFKKLFHEKTKTIVAISHRLTTIKKADVIYMMKDGRIAERGTYAELVKKQAEFYKMFESQL